MRGVARWGWSWMGDGCVDGFDVLNQSRRKPWPDPGIGRERGIHFRYSPHRWSTDRMPEPALSFREMEKIHIAVWWYFTRIYPDFYYIWEE